MIVIPMAGLSRRFLDAGYGRPKYELDLAGRPVFDWALLSFARYFESQPIIIVYRDLEGLTGFLEERVATCGCGTATFVPLSSSTDGQAETVERGLDAVGVPSDEPVTIFNIDTFRPNLAINADSRLAGCDGYLETFVGEGTHWSFVEPDEPGSVRARRVAEKVRISEFCCTGLYYFATANLFQRAYQAELRSRSSHELFVAPLYQHLIKDGADIRHSVVSKDEVFFCGTPSEYEQLRESPEQIRAAFRPIGLGS